MNTVSLNNLEKMWLIEGFGSIIIGIPFAFRLFGPSETEVVDWGILAIYLGLAVLLLTIVYLIRNSRVIRILLITGFTVIGLMQIPPIYAWFFFHGGGLTDHPPLAGDFKVHWIYSIPHICMLIVSHKNVMKMLKG